MIFTTWETEQDFVVTTSFKIVHSASTINHVETQWSDSLQRAGIDSLNIRNKSWLMVADAATYGNLFWLETATKNEDFVKISDWATMKHFSFWFKSKVHFSNISSLFVDHWSFCMSTWIGVKNKDRIKWSWSSCSGRCSCRSGSCCSSSCGGSGRCSSGSSCGCCGGCCWNGTVPVDTWTTIRTVFHTRTVLETVFVVRRTWNYTRWDTSTSIKTLLEFFSETVLTSMEIIIVIDIITLKVKLFSLDCCYFWKNNAKSCCEMRNIFTVSRDQRRSTNTNV